MVKYISLLFFTLLAFGMTALADEVFSARVDQTHIGINENLKLQLDLSNLRPVSQPNLTGLDKDFQIIGQQQSFENKIINGVSSSSTVWTLTLVPTRVGQLSIPSLAITTNRGELKTEPLIIQVTNQAKTTTTTNETMKASSFIAKASKNEPYKNEPVLVTFELTSSQSIRNIQLGNLSVKNAIVERQGDPKVHQKIINGRERQVLDVSYLVTPLKEGDLTIPALLLRGEAPAPRHTNSMLPKSESFFGNSDDDAMSGMQSLMDQFTQDTNLFDQFAMMKPIAISSEPIHLHILPSIAGVNPWLPATSLKVSETWSSDQPRAGDPLTRTITTEAIGLSPSQLPGFEDQFKSNDKYKVYPDQPKLTSQLNRGLLDSQKIETFTIIPQAAEDLHLPAMQLVWWDTNSQTQRIAQLPEKVIHVLPGSQLAQTEPPKTNQTMLTQTITPHSVSQATPVVKSQSHLLMFILLSLAFILTIFILMIFYKRPKIILKETTTPKQTEKKSIGKSDLDNCSSINELNLFLQKYSHSYWSVPANASLSKIFAAAEQHLKTFDLNQTKELRQQIEEALYANKQINFKNLKSEVAKLIFQKNKSSKQIQEKSNLPELNPS